MNVRRRSAAALAAIAVLGAAAAPALAADPTPAPTAHTPSGLFGTSDPQYDGVWRQSLALLAQRTVGVTPAPKAVDWLTGQQCADGSFAAFRAEPGKDCDAKTMVDTNSTGAAVQALAALGGQGEAAGKAVGWLKSVQNEDGGWGYTPGGPSDANSTSVVIGALAAAGEQPGNVKKGEKGGKSPYDALLSFALPCDDPKGAGAFAYQPEKDGSLAANADATAAAVLGALGKGFAAEAGKGAEGGCADKPTPEQAAAAGAAHLAGAVAEKGHLTSAMPGAEDQPDHGNTADTVVALAAQGGAERAAKPLAWLEKNGGAWAEQAGPAAWAQLVFAAHATGTDPRAFGGTDLVAGLNATGPAPQEAAASTAPGKEAGQKDEKNDEKNDDSSGFGLWWYVGVFLVAGAGIGFLLSGRARKRNT
ncbi:prenyltransferase/squalene oxidase repeat-containing protein [Streptomyces tagetis]|uniref:Squalene cyclase C-terminal domain-containing protein n=1 Tax=Streptomyces tagetis TaxID=2820809 RepID=A0A940XV19_9ACTN|nr:prenyltransferase/squalene oxidase repeat-containing protein [Streptomyces sp. RG38]MBQ0830138.1 hypothetical protein [Streptomyces sp. RG38]